MDTSRRLLNTPALDVLTLPSLKEGFPYTLLEATQAEVPVLASRVGGIPEIIPDQDHGTLFAPANEQELAQGLLTYLSPEIRNAHARAAKLHTDSWTAKAMTNATLAVYQV